MMEWPALSLIQRLLEEHELDRADPRLVPCLHAELREDVEVLSAAARRYGGALYDLSAPSADWEDPTGPIKPTRRDLVLGITSGVGASVLPAELEFDTSVGRLEARLRGVVSPPEPSLVPILRGASVIASAALDEHDFLILCAETSSVDPARQQLLWQLLTIDPRDLELRADQTVVVLLGPSADPDIDYARQPEVRLVVRPNRLLRRSQSQTDSAVRALASGTKPFVLLLGAGASASAGIRLGNAYRNLALQGLVGSNSTDEEVLEDGFFEWLHQRDRFLPGERNDRTTFLETLTLERVLRETFHELGFRPRTDSAVVREIVADCDRALGYVRPGRVALRHLASTLPGRLILITVNFDQLIEEGMSANHIVLATPEEFEQHIPDLTAYAAGDASKPVPILKLHGTVERVDSLVATIDDTAVGFHDAVRAALDAIVQAVETPMTWAWIGCSMRDRDVSAWLRGLPRDALDEWWVDPFPPVSLDSFFDEHRRLVWSERQRTLDDRLVVETSDRFLRQLSALMTSP